MPIRRRPELPFQSAHHLLEPIRYLLLDPTTTTRRGMILELASCSRPGIWRLSWGLWAIQIRGLLCTISILTWKSSGTDWTWAARVPARKCS